MMSTKNRRRPQRQTTAIGTLIPADLAERFDEFVTNHGYLKTRAVAAAIRMFMAANDAERASAMSSN